MITSIVPFLEAIGRGELNLPQCDICRRYHWYPLPLCPHCQSATWSWVPVAQRGTVFTWTVVRHAFRPDKISAVPFVVALVEIDGAPGVRIVTNLVQCDTATLKIGMSVVASFEVPAWGTDPMPVFKPAAAQAVSTALKS